MSEVKSLQFKANDKAPIQLQLFGYFEIRVHGQSVAELSGAAKRILSLLALGGRTPTRRERLAFALWCGTQRLQDPSRDGRWIPAA